MFRSEWVVSNPERLRYASQRERPLEDESLALDGITWRNLGGSLGEILADRLADHLADHLAWRNRSAPPKAAPRMAARRFGGRRGGGWLSAADWEGLAGWMVGWLVAAR